MSSSKRKRQWKTTGPQKKHKLFRTLQPGFTGLWVSTPMNKELRAMKEIIDLLETYYPSNLPDQSEDQSEEIDNLAVEDAIEAELELLKPQTVEKIEKSKRFLPIWDGHECKIFVRFSSLDKSPSELALQICSDILTKQQSVCTRFVQRITPIQKSCFASLDSIEKIAPEVLEPIFKSDTPVKFAVQYESRFHTVLNRDTVISSIVTIVKDLNPSHSVDLKKYDKLIICSIYKNFAGLSVVTCYDKYLKYNLDALYKQRLADTEKE